MALVSRGKTWVSLIVLLTLIWAGAVVPAPSASAAASTPFTDVPAGHWAEKHIAKLALQGLLKGDNGLFNPNGNLTREQAVLIAIRFMGLEDKVQTNEVFALPATIAVDNYYKPYINFAFQQKLLDLTEEAALANSEPKQAWGSSPATREWMAGLLVRALGKEADAAAKSGTATSFADNASINKNYIGAINVAVGLGLLKGVDGNKFDPQGKLTRAMAATLFSRSESLVSTAFSGQATGIWLSVGPDKLTMLHADGTVTTYSVSANTLYSRADSEQLQTSDALKPYGKALVISADGSKADFAEQLDDTPQVRTVEGQLVVVNTSKHQISLLTGEDVQPYAYDPNFPPSVTDGENNAIGLTDVPTGTNVKMTVDAFTSSPRVLAIALSSSLVSKKGTGTITAVDLTNGTLQFKDDAAAAAETRTVSSTATVQKDGKLVTLSDLKPGDVISFEVKNGVLTSVIVTKSSMATTVSGYFFKLDKSDKTISYTNALASGDINAKFYKDGLTVSIPNASGSTLDDLYKGDAITMTLDADGKVTAITVSGRSFISWTGATISDYAASSGYLIVKGADGTTKALSIGDSTKFDINGTAITKDTALLNIAKGKRVNLGFTDTQLVFLSFVSQYSGTVVKNDAVARSLQLTLDEGGTVTVYYGTPVVEIFGVDNANYSNVGQGDHVVAMLDSTQSLANSILVKKTVQYTVVGVNAAQNKLTVQNSAGTTTEWTLTTGVSILDANGNAIGLDKLAAGDTVNASYVGKTLKSIKYVPVSYGIVTAVDAAAGTVTLQQGSNAPAVMSVGTSAIVVKGGSTSGTLASLSVNDRVEIRKNEADAQVITVVTGVSKTVWYAETDNLTLNFLKTTLNSDSVKVSSTAYIHQGATPLRLGDLNNGDAVTVYILRNKAVEIEKA